VDPSTCVLTCVGAIDNLSVILADHPLSDCIKTDAPLSSESLRILNAPPDASNPLVPDMLTPARRTVGIVSFVSYVRPDIQLAFKVLSRCTNERRLTVYAWREIRRMAAYLVSTKHLGLTLRRTNGLLTSYVDSSLANGPEGRSWGGFAMRFESDDLVSGCFDTKCSLPNTVTEATGASELHQAVRAMKAVMGYRILLKELGFAPTGATPINTDARVLIDGTRCRKVSNESKWMSVRYAMTRRAEEVNAIHFQKFPTALDFSDIVTKPLTGQLFRRLRAAVLGLPPDET
jgi:hypothetical protein